MDKNERNEIAILLSKKYSVRDIATALERSPNTISQEIRKNSTQGIYDPKKAQQKSYVKRHNASFRGSKIVRNLELREFVEIHLCDEQSPKAIEGRIKFHEKHLLNISKNTIYDFLDGPHGKLIREKRKKRKYRRKNSKVTQLKDRVFIDKRPKVIQKRKRVGDCEGDFIVSGKGESSCLLVVVERKTRYVCIEQIVDVSVDNVHEAFVNIQKKFPEMRTLTLDNDILFKMHKVLETLLGIPLYFCHPYHSWEKGSVENANKYIRRFIPKGSDISQYDLTYIQAVEEKCNQRFMEVIKFYTPQEKIESYRLKKKKQRPKRC